MNSDEAKDIKEKVEKLQETMDNFLKLLSIMSGGGIEQVDRT